LDLLLDPDEVPLLDDPLLDDLTVDRLELLPDDEDRTVDRLPDPVD
jgi:hypothetical protein